MLRTDLDGQGIDVDVLDIWYKKDSNAVPPTSVLQPISSILKNFNNKVKFLPCNSSKFLNEIKMNKIIK